MTSESVQLGMATSLFGVGLIAALAGLWTVLAREYQEVMRGLSRQGGRIAAEALGEKSVHATVEAAATLVQAVTLLVRTATGTGLILLLTGLATCYLAYTMLPHGP